ncbi:hypothetical protein I5M27_08685 [Adhaeribacter sp. BT258]|uniref:Immunity protein 50 n=1 Tax=Adhaeribacter terrigena TaxID=2793070 RepID=A0ABS1C0Y8_9BACT|nr:hypothetical protein [Adhaeribacter terrigena]MBK0403061.1 hypothetical protein [Adhaeribacter terrigena]
MIKISPSINCTTAQLKYYCCTDGIDQVRGEVIIEVELIKNHKDYPDNSNWLLEFVVPTANQAYNPLDVKKIHIDLAEYININPVTEDYLVLDFDFGINPAQAGAIFKGLIYHMGDNGLFDYGYEISGVTQFVPEGVMLSDFMED